MVSVLFTFYVQTVLKLKKIIPAPKGELHMSVVPWQRMSGVTPLLLMHHFVEWTWATSTFTSECFSFTHLITFVERISFGFCIT